MAAVPASLYRRLAAVIDGLRSGRTAWFVLELDFPHEPLTAANGETGFDSEADAHAALAAFKGGADRCAVFGPCKTQRELSRLTVTHLTTRDLDGNEAMRKLHADVDMVVWSMSAFDKFVAPYYFGLQGSGEQAFEQVRRLRAKVKESGIFGHKWPTKGAAELDELMQFDPFLIG